MALVSSDHDIILALGEDLPIGIWVARAPSGVEVYANRTFAEIMGTGVKKDVAVGGYSEPYGILTRDKKPYPEDRMPFVRALTEKKVVVVDDITIRRPDNTCVDIRAYSRPIMDSEGTITHVVIAFFDITREVAAEKARAESEQRLHRAQRLEGIGTLAGGIAHDFNNLIFGIKLIAADLASSETDSERKEALSVIDEITERSATLTRSLLGFARRGKHRAVPVCLSDVVASMAELLRRTASGLELTMELAANDRGCVIGDQSQLEQVIMNLVGNARDALHGTGRVVIRTYDVQLSGPPSPNAIGAAGAGAYVVLEVSDDGPGIPSDLRERVFEPYFTTKIIGPDRGTGLGLATVSGIVEIHGGSTEIDVGLDGRGTTMRIYLPVATRAAEPAVPPKKVTRPTGTGTVLVVDDDATVRRALARSLSLFGYHTLEASSGAEAIEIYRTSGSQIRAVILDMVMPGMSGRSTYLGLRELDPAVGVILMSGYTLNDQVQEILDLGVKAFVTKPHSAEHLAQILAEIVAPTPS